MTRLFFLLLAACAFFAPACEKHPLEGQHNYGSGKHAEFMQESGVAKPVEASKAPATPAPAHP